MKFNIKDYELGSRPFWAIAASILILAALLLFVTNSVAYGEGTGLLPIYSVETDKKQVAITFNCAWSPKDIPEILEILEEYEVKATFFTLGQWAKENPQELVLIAKAGHEIGNHSNTHPDMSKLSPEKIMEELSKASDYIEKACTVSPKLFRAPGGSYSNTLIKTASENGYTAIQWDIDSRDWKGYSSQKIIDSVTQNVQKGSIILFHCGKENTLTALPHILENLKMQGYEFVPVGELIYKEDYTLDHTGRQHSLKRKYKSDNMNSSVG